MPGFFSAVISSSPSGRSLPIFLQAFSWPIPAMLQVPPASGIFFLDVALRLLGFGITAHLSLHSTPELAASALDIFFLFVHTPPSVLQYFLNPVYLKKSACQAMPRFFHSSRFLF